MRNAGASMRHRKRRSRPVHGYEILVPTTKFGTDYDYRVALMSNMLPTGCICKHAAPAGG